MEAISETLKVFKQGIDEFLARRQYFVAQVLPGLKEGQDFHVIKGKKSLSKGGAEKLATIHGLHAVFEQDNATLKIFENVPGLMAYICTLYHGQILAGQGRGASTMSKNGNDANKTIKLAQKSAFVDAVIRTTGLSDIFTQDLEDMPVASIQTGHEVVPEEEQQDSPITAKQKQLLTDLVLEHVDDDERRNAWFCQMDGFSRGEASDYIKEFLGGRL